MATQVSLRKSILRSWGILQHHPDIAPSDFHFFSKHKQFSLCFEKNTVDDEELKVYDTTYLNGLEAEEYDTRIQQLTTIRKNTKICNENM
ncbi:hypothetical protein AVEN_191588-1 [Araneus ventricosus]|uniref:Uncharacterized protein n=1 Tax=Araneus ventricosus TaxID=182803 RepID=A0A4Y2KQN4_ARAVE|nr:hypothetical protein AVEN_191588-1 [Araneus ventricosus]